MEKVSETKDEIREKIHELDYEADSDDWRGFHPVSQNVFFNPKAFYNAFVVHEKLFRDVEFRPSLKKGQIVAFCDCRTE